MAKPGPEENRLFEIPEVAQLILQAQLFAGDYYTLSRTPWITVFEEWLKTISADERAKWAEFFERDVLIGVHPGYTHSKVYRLLHHNENLTI